MSEMNRGATTESNTFKERWLIPALIIFLVLFDQLTKYIVKQSMYLGESIPMWGNFFKLTYIENPGMAFGIEMDNKLLFMIISVVAVVVVFIYMIRMRNERYSFRLALAFILGGAVGNLIDRLLYGRVVDFFDFEFIDIEISAFKWWFINFQGYELYRWPIFNIADISVSCGMILLAWLLVFSPQAHSHQLSSEQ